jgi:hypothetical protein
MRVSAFQQPSEENGMETTFAGIIPPMLTPLTPDERIDCAAVERLVNFLIGHGVHGLFILGSIGEGPSCGRRRDGRWPRRPSPRPGVASR